MKERIVLFTIIFGLWVFLYVFQNYFNTLWGLIFLCAGMITYAVYLHLSTIHNKRQQKKKPLVVNENFKPFVSIMIPAHNEENVIAKTVENVLQLNYENFEVIIIDDRSEDNTASVIKDLEQKYERVIALIRNKDAYPGKSAVLNDALLIAKGEAILVFDADAKVAPDFLSKLVPNLEPEDVGAVQARKVIFNKDINILTRCQNNEYTLDTHFQTGRDSVKGAVELRGNGELIKRTALDDIGGWNNHTITDDLDMSTQLHIKGWDVRFCPEAIVYEEGIIYLVPLFKQRRRWLEGSIRRYLEHFGEVLKSKDMSLRASLDMTAYISEFIMPIWLIMEIVFQIFRVVTKSAPTNCIYSSLLVGGAIAVCFTLAARYSLRRFDNLSRPQALKQAIETSLYLFFIWFPVVMFICFKILFCKKDMNWGKTTHGLILEQGMKDKELVRN
ncbi:MAG: glycosyltransferase family 2 protein [Candidatus Gastranaerophilales bacterium]|nr:glycosyltransferase family 2 protein [Candidatus Gastranaerophilales bacterium]